ncbi:unnamed protein product [Adineta steineri]|uniref:BRCT domain-containing protein n=1 Tax=Adineta steineri TaxID=433720 RepID=A0A813X3S6_9BILA|nr:unnamed protein product [Adineta steineri]
MKRTIITSKTTGRRYFLVRSSSRPGGRRYYVCSTPDCELRVARESNLYCRTHAQSNNTDSENINDISEKSDDDGDESIANDQSELLDEETSQTEQQDTNVDSNDNEDENNDSMSQNDSIDADADADNNGNATLPLSSRQKAKANRTIEIDEATGARTFRDSTGRRRYLCTNATCTNMLKRQTDIFCITHANTDLKDLKEPPTEPNVDKSKKPRTNQKRYSAPPAASNHKKERFRSPFSNNNSTGKDENGTNGNHSEEYESPEKVPESTGTKRSFRDASGRIRFLCSLPTCKSRVHRQAETYCRRHTREFLNGTLQTSMDISTTNDSINHTEEETDVQKMDVNHNKTDTPSHEPSTKKRKHDSQIALTASLNQSSIPADKMVIATTTLLDEQWANILIFLRKFPQVQLSSNLVVNDSTTHLLVDDSEKSLHCTITKKIVQAAVRRHIFIISARWINDCINANKFLDEHSYEILSDSHTTLRLSIQDYSNNNQYLFKSNYGFAIECRQCQGSINRNELMELIELTGAQIYDHNITVEILTVLCDANEKNLTKIKEKYLQSNLSNIKYVTSDFLLKSIIKFEMQDIDRYSL